MERGKGLYERGRNTRFRCSGYKRCICYVAMGRFDAWAEAFLGKWDYSAAALIVQEAGGRVTDFCGNGHFMDGHHIIATNGYLHSVYQQLIAEVPPLDM